MEWLTVGRDQNEADDTLENRFECGEGGSAPHPLPKRKAAEVDGGHQENESTAQEEHCGEIQSAAAGVRDDDGAKKPNEDARYQSDLHDRPGELVEILGGLLA